MTYYDHTTDADFNLTHMNICADSHRNNFYHERAKNKLTLTAILSILA
jgi:hypothetical protein